MRRNTAEIIAFVMSMASASALGAPLDAVPRFAVVERIPGPPTVTGWDYATIDAKAKRLFYLPSAKPDMKAPPLHLPAMPPIPPAAPGSFEFLVVRAVDHGLPTDQHRN